MKRHVGLPCRLSVLVFGVLSGLACAPRGTVSVHVRMISQQEAYFRNEVVPAFDKHERVDVRVIPYSTIDTLPQLLRSQEQVGLIKIPFDKGPLLCRLGLIRPLEDILTPEELREYKNDYVLTSLGSFDGRHYLIPRKFETRIMVYRKSKVADAVVLFDKHRFAIDSVLKTFNGKGLPSGYFLEEDPNEWDYFDIFCVGWIWAHTPYGETISPRIGHRGRRYSGTALRIVDRVYQCGGDSTSVLSMSGESVLDAFHWEALYACASVYNHRMWENSWDGTQIWQGFRTNDVFLAFMTQLDCFFIHGTGQDSLEGYLEDPDDMGVALMPTGCSPLLSEAGAVARQGAKSVTTGGWWWGIPKNTADPRLAYRLARHFTSTTTQIQECTRFGMIPVKKDILGDMSMMFGGGWITGVYETSFKQLVENRSVVVPTNPHYGQISSLYLDAWYDIVVERNWSPDRQRPDRAHVARVLSVYERRARAILSATDR